MADPKVKAANGGSNIVSNGTANGNHSSDKNSKQSKIWQLLSLAKELSKDAETIQDFEKAAEQKRILDQDLEAKKGEVQRLREFNDKIVREFSEYKTQASVKTEMLFAEFEHKYKTYDSNKEAVKEMELEVKALRGNLETAEEKEKQKETELMKLQQSIQSAEVQAKSQTSEIKEMAAERDINRSAMQRNIMELDAYKSKLADAMADLGDGLFHDYGPDGLRKLGLDLKALSEKCHDLVLEYFNGKDSAKDAYSEVQELKTRFPKIPLSTASTKQAAQLRCAAAEAVIAEVLVAQIFTPFYLANGTKAAATSLLEVFGEDEKRRSIYRCQMLRVVRGAEEAARIEEDIVRKASNEVRATLHPLVAVAKQGAFYSAIPSFFREALNLWAQVQKSRELITAETPDTSEAQLPGRFDEYAQPGGSKKMDMDPDKLEIAASLFPQVVSREELIFTGMALWLDQIAVAEKSAETTKKINGNGNGVNGESLQQGGVRVRRKSVILTETPLVARNTAHAL